LNVLHHLGEHPVATVTISPLTILERKALGQESLTILDPEQGILETWQTIQLD
jgi:hypothetical protein